MKYGVAHIDAGLSLKRPGARQHFVKQHTRGKDVRSRIHLVTARLFGSCVGGRAVRNTELG